MDKWVYEITDLLIQWYVFKPYVFYRQRLLRVALVPPLTCAKLLPKPMLVVTVSKPGSVCVCSVAQLCPTLCKPTDGIAHQSALSLGFSRQEYWSGLPYLTLHQS